MSRCVVITTILRPSDQVIAHCRRGLDDGTEVIVVADRKTPVAEYKSLESEFSNLHVLSIDQQHDLFSRLSAAVPFNHYARKNVGYAFAISRGHTAIFDTDDDNVTQTGWQDIPSGTQRLKVRRRDGAPDAVAFFNVYGLYTSAHLWPRGFPLEQVRISDSGCEVVEPSGEENVAVWQGLVDGDPDVDAIARLTSPHAASDFRFDPAQRRVVLDRGVLCPLNSQNTWWVDPSAFLLMFLPGTTTFRACDILRGYVAQHTLWRRGAHAGFVQATAFQVRNPHDLLADFASELPLYLDATKINMVLHAAARRFTGAADDLVAAYDALAEANLADPRERDIAEAWLTSIG
jgi:hypothetical protein